MVAGRRLTVVGHQVLVELVPLILQHLAQVVGHLAGDLLHIGVQLAQIIGEAHQLVQGADLWVKVRIRT